MVKSITAYQADDGTVHADERSATEHDARCALKKLGIFNEATQNAVISRAYEIHRALSPLIPHLPQPAGPQFHNDILEG